MEGDLRLENQLCFALYDAARTMAGAYQAALTPLGLTYPQFLVLLVLWEKDGSTVSQLGSRLHLDSGTLSPLLKRLEALGLVERRRESQDGRTVTIRLTKRGAGLESRASSLQGDLRDQLAMSDEELAALHVLAARFCNVARSSPDHPPTA
ncbi:MULTISPECIES: MarR family winged helix-turn-helix transcriptional regulator [unclassified Arthrobacter]|uniref:MarR family winged helix-turn-helix transcriptional regulator n=1 Tax=unclassified Arthrobacter TaxID=235627 RepID=UPI0014917FD6|nr:MULTISPECIES: MarR family transcriptional regulator [unclassified Arthrobacter]MBE0011582.1 MarR family transcriptional regulator [Arthrobacter sp. AET 35A]NOJ61465.1 MarR family transcriptional regulator [Arthrobacter sp. 260]